MLEDVITTGAVLIVASAVLAAISRRVENEERRLLLFGFLAHVGAVFVQVWVIEQVYGGGDIDGYYRSGVELANALRNDFEFIFPEMVKVFFHDTEANLPFAVFGGVGPTGSLSVITAVLFFFLSDSLIGSSMVVALVAFFGKVAIARAVGEDLSPQNRRLVLAAAVLVPSVVFWSSTIAKEAVIIAFMGFALLLMRPAIAGQVRPLKLFAAGCCLVPVAMIKPYVLLPLSMALAAWFYWERSNRKGVSIAIRPAYVVVAAVGVLGFFVVVGQISPQFAVENIAKSTATSQSAGMRVEGGSNYQLREPVEEEQGLKSQLVLAPIALPTALFRPFIFEVKNPMMLVNALETSVLLFLTIRLLVRGGFSQIRKAVMASPTLVFCLVFTIVMATPVGLATTNMGSLSRYRIPFMPFFVALVLILDAMFQRQPDRLRFAGLSKPQNAR
jgi:hypothetical protein